MDKETEQEVDVYVSTTVYKKFTPTSESGTVDIEFIFNSYELDGHSVVVFLSLYLESAEIATLRDINDVNQTITFKNPVINVTATDKATGKSEGFVSKNTTIVAEVSYTDLIVGKNYSISSFLYDGWDHYCVDDVPVYEELDFTAESESGTVFLEFNFDSTALKDKSLDVFVMLFLDRGIDVDMDKLADGLDTVKFKDASVNPKDPGTPSKPAGTPVPKTGDTNNIVIGFLLISSLGAALLISKKKRTTK